MNMYFRVVREEVEQRVEPTGVAARDNEWMAHPDFRVGLISGDWQLADGIWMDMIPVQWQRAICGYVTRCGEVRESVCEKERIYNSCLSIQEDRKYLTMEYRHLSVFLYEKVRSSKITRVSKI